MDAKPKPTLAQRERISNRLARVEGQLRGVQRLVEADADCELVLQQMTAARRALDRAYQEMLACVIESGVVRAREPTESEAALLAEVRRLISKYS